MNRYLEEAFLYLEETLKDKDEMAVLQAIQSIHRAMMNNCIILVSESGNGAGSEFVNLTYVYRGHRYERP